LEGIEHYFFGVWVIEVKEKEFGNALIYACITAFFIVCFGFFDGVKGSIGGGGYVFLVEDEKIGKAGSA
jgi:hypothetical protein